MFKRRDIPPVLLLLLLIILVMLTLSQILVVHNGRYGRSVHSMRKLQLELREMDVNLHALMMQNVPSIELNRRLLQNQINAHRFAEIISKAARKDPEEEFLDLPSSRLRRTDQEVTTYERTRYLRREFHETREPNRLTVGKLGVSRSNNSGSVPLSGHHLGRSLSVSDSYGTEDNRSAAVAEPQPANTMMQRSSTATGYEDADNGREGTPLMEQPEQGVNNRSPSFYWQGTLNNALPVKTNDTLSDALPEQSQATLGNNVSDRILSDGPPIEAYMTLSDGSPVHSQRTTGDGSPMHLEMTPNGAPSTQNRLDTRSRGHKEKISYCPSVPPLLRGNIGVHLENSSRLRWEHVAAANPDVQPGGAWSPRHCVARHRVAIIIPYRDREQHLITLLYYLHPVLQRQELDYRIYVVEQYGRDTFNKARIMNIAFVEALKQYHFQCFVFHDVDLVPEDDRNMYSCPQQPRHMSVAIDEMGYKLAYQELVGGVLNMRTEHFQRVNGYSNLYWGWGAEDDDMAYRIMHVGLKITRPPETTARYKMAKHTKRKPSDWRKRAKLLYTGTRRFQFDGLNSLQYKVTHIKEMPLYTHLLVDIGRPPRGF